MRGSRLVEEEVRFERVGATSSGTSWCSINVSACFATWAPVESLTAEQPLGIRRAARGKIGDDERLEPEEAGELLVDAGRRVVAVDERVGERAPAYDFVLVDLCPRH